MGFAVVLNIIYVYGFLKIFIKIISERIKLFKTIVKTVSGKIKTRSSLYLQRFSISKRSKNLNNKKKTVAGKPKSVGINSERNSREIASMDNQFQIKGSSLSSRLSSYEKVTHDIVEKENIFYRKDDKTTISSIAPVRDITKFKRSIDSRLGNWIEREGRGIEGRKQI